MKSFRLTVFKETNYIFIEKHDPDGIYLSSVDNLERLSR
jgi:hypothetical protein